MGSYFSSILCVRQSEWLLVYISSTGFQEKFGNPP